MDHRPRSQSVLHSPILLPSRVSRILQRVTNFKSRLHLHSRRTDKDAHDHDRSSNNPYPSHGGAAKPFMSQPILAMGNMLVEPFSPGDGEDSSAHSDSPSGSEFRRPIEPQHMSVTRGLPTATHTARGHSIDGLPFGAGTPANKTDHPQATPPTITPSIFISDSETPRGTVKGRAHKKPAHSPTPSIVISSSPETSSQGKKPHSGTKQAKPKIDTSSFFIRKPSRSKDIDDDYHPPTPHPNAVHGPAAPPVPPPPLPTFPSSLTLSPAPTVRPVLAPALSQRSVSESATSTSTSSSDTRPPEPTRRFSLTPHDARLSPSIILRPPPLPLLNLPTLPPASASPSTSLLGSTSISGRLRGMPELPHEGATPAEHEDEGDDDDDDMYMDMDEEGHHSSSSRVSDFEFGFDSSDVEDRPRPSFSSSIDDSASLDPHSASFGSSHGGAASRSHSRSSSYAHTHDHFLSLPGPDTSRIGLSFLERPSSVPDRKGKGKAREPDEEGERDGDVMMNMLTPTAGAPYPDYFSSRTDSLHHQNQHHGAEQLRTPRPEDALRSRARAPGLLQPSVSQEHGAPARPGMSKRASRSMIDIHAVLKRQEVEEMVRKEAEAEGAEMRRRRSVRVSQLGVPVADTDTDQVGIIGGQPSSPSHKRLSKAPPYELLPPSLRRRRSMPMFTESTPPPPYPAFPLSSSNSGSGWEMRITPRDDEGRERLPGYSNGIYMRGEVPRKMEFVEAGVQAKDRKWRRVVCVVEGTAFKVYRCPGGKGRVGKLGKWWEKKVGVGDVSLGIEGGVQAGGGERERERVSKGAGEGGAGQTELLVGQPSTPGTPVSPARTQPRLSGEHPYVPGQPPPLRTPPPHPYQNPSATRSKLNLAASLFRSTKSHHGRSSSVTTTTTPPQRSPRPSLNIPGGGRPGTPALSLSDSHSHLSVPSPSSSSVHSTLGSARAPDELDPTDLIHAYTMQNAESGLGSDYIKRRNVIRVRVEGEQFLIQAKDVPDVVAWIEALQASANVALDLDERLMPKGPLFPRRRRRRNRRIPTDTVTAQPPEAEASTSTVVNAMSASLTTGIV